MPVEFTAHNIRLDDGSFTKPDVGFSMDAHPWCVSAKRVLDAVFPGDKTGYRLADLGCLEGGYAVEFARMGFQVLGLEIRASNIAACRYVKANTDLPTLQFVQDDAWNIGTYGVFDAIFCCGLLYHLDRPRQFLRKLSGVTRRLLFLQTHFSVDDTGRAEPSVDQFRLSPMTENESLRGRWYTEFPPDAGDDEREKAKWSSWGNWRSFWIQREHLLQTIQDVGFDLVLEQFDSLGQGIAEAMTGGSYERERRSTFVGIKTQARSLFR